MSAGSVDLVRMALPGLGGLSEAENAKKIRKPYTITKSRESWTEQEHDKFLEALQLFDRDWKKIEAFVGSKTVIQIRSHAQKYFLKVQKNGTREHVPPPRPKRKAAHPYPQKASKNVPLPQQVSPAFASASSQQDSGYSQRADSSSILKKSGISTPTVSSWVHHTIPSTSVIYAHKDDMGTASIGTGNNCSSGSDESSPRTWPPHSQIPEQGSQSLPVRVKPDFSQVYHFIGSVFDPNTTGHLKKLKEMDPIDLETVLLLMKNLSVNLSSPDFEEHAGPYVVNEMEEHGMVAGTPANQSLDVWDDHLQSTHLGSVNVQEGEDLNSQQKNQDLPGSSDSQKCAPDGDAVTSIGSSFHGNLDSSCGMPAKCFSDKDPT